MQLYWHNADATSAWGNTANWFEDAAATVNHGALPGSGDSCALAAGEMGTPQIKVSVNLGGGVCSFAVNLYHGGTIAGGTWTNGVGFTTGPGATTISGGTFTAVVAGNGTSGHAITVTGGAFTYPGNGGAYWNVSGGYFTEGFTLGAGSVISGGYFNPAAFTNSGGTISGGYAVTGVTVQVNGVSFSVGQGIAGMGTASGAPVGYTDPGAASVVTGTSYTFAGTTENGSYPTTATSQATQLATDEAAVTAAAAGIATTTTILGVTGTLNMGLYGLLSNYTDPGAASVVAGTSYKFAGTTENGSYPTTAASNAAQLATDAAAVTAAAAGIATTTTILGVTGTLNMGLYGLLSNYTDPGAANVVAGTTYMFAGATQTGTLALATQSSVNAIAETAAKLDAMLQANGESWQFTPAAVAGAFLVDLADVQDAAPDDSLATVCLAGLHSGVAGTTWTIRKTDGTTKLAKTVTASAGAQPIVGVN